MTGKGTVISTKNGMATVRVRKSSACGHDCGECNLCQNPEITIDILNPIGARSGDTVIIGTPSHIVLKWAFILYILPIAGAMLCLAVLSAFDARLAVSVGAVIIWTCLWFVYARRYSKRSVGVSSALEVVNEEN